MAMRRGLTRSGRPTAGVRPDVRSDPPGSTYPSHGEVGARAAGPRDPRPGLTPSNFGFAVRKERVCDPATGDMNRTSAHNDGSPAPGGATFSRDLFASLVVFLVAVPLAL